MLFRIGIIFALHLFSLLTVLCTMVNKYPKKEERGVWFHIVHITKTCPCKISFSSKILFYNLSGKMLLFLIFLLKILIAGTVHVRLAEAVLTSTHNLCFGAKIRK